MYLKVESVSAVEITSSRSSSSSSAQYRQGIAKIPVPLRQGGGAAAAVAAAAAATADNSACTPDEIYCYTQSNSNHLNRSTVTGYQQQQQHHHYTASVPITATLSRGLCQPFRSHFTHDTTAADTMGIHHVDATASIVDVQHGPGRPDWLEQVMSLHPQYLKIYNKSQSFIMRGDGPLPFHYRHYIAIMAAGRHQCSYLIQQQVNEFLQQGGDERWLQGLHSIPAKLRDLYEINKILAHRPWLITKDHIEKLTKGSDSWSLGELVHALVILSHYHAISSFVFGVGIGDGRDEPPSCCGQEGQSTPVTGSPAARLADAILPDRHAAKASPPLFVGSNGGSKVNSLGGSPSALEFDQQEVSLDALMKRMKSLAEHRQEFSAEEQTKRYEHVESQSAELVAISVSSNSDVARLPKPEISQFIDDPDFTYQDFARRGSVSLIPTFRVQDYSWDDHAFSLINRLYNDVGNLLDDKFRLMYQLTYNFMGSKRDVDTSRFRTAIWNYIQCMFGIRHDDYDYGEVNQVLERSLKAYIKMAVCFPERVTRADYDNILKELHHSEKIHVNLMMLEARIQAELLYALRAVMRYMI